MKVLIAVVAVFAIAVVAFVIWGSTPLGPMPEALAALESDANVAVGDRSPGCRSRRPRAQNTG